MPTLYVSDLDGTLLGPGARLSARSTGLLNEAIRLGARFSVATARTPATVAGLLSEVDCRLPLVVMTGAAIWDPRSGEYLHASFHREETALSLAETYRRAGLSTFVYTLGKDNILHIYHIGPLSSLEKKFIAEREGSPYKRFHIPADGMSHLPENMDRVLLFFSMGPTGDVGRVYSGLRGREDVRSVFYHDIYGDEVALMEVFSPEASKASAVGILAEMTGSDRIVAYGDNVNDLPILEIADDSVAVANAVDAVRLAAGRVIGPNTEDCVALDILSQTERSRE